MFIKIEYGFKDIAYLKVERNHDNPSLGSPKIISRDISIQRFFIFSIVEVNFSF